MKIIPHEIDEQTAMQTQLPEVAAMRTSRGMTLIEILVVLAIIGLIMGGVSVMAFNQFKEAKVKDAWTEVRSIETNCETFMLQRNGKCPKSLQDLKAAGIIRSVAKDPWNSDWLITCPGEHGSVDVVSNGPDGAPNTDDDIRSWETPNEEGAVEEKKS